jgi:uncharacterized protein YqgV (UPF0045/DUF77 family)
MGICIEGEWRDVMAVLDRCFQEIQKNSHRVCQPVLVGMTRAEGLLATAGLDQCQRVIKFQPKWFNILFCM